MPDDESPEDEDEWDDEWNRDDWYELGVADRDYRNEATWAEWGVKLLVIALVLPAVLGLLVFSLILLF
jgi:hypothetical protein